MSTPALDKGRITTGDRQAQQSKQQNEGYKKNQLHRHTSLITAERKK